MSEISILLVNLVALAIAYLYIYPRFADNDVKKLAWLDTAVGSTVLLILAPFYWNSPNDFTLFVVDFNWWVFSILVYALIELPLFFLYVKARGLGSEYRQLWKGGGYLTDMASEKSVKKQLSDTKWDGLRSRGALRFLVIGANVNALLGTVFLFLVGDTKWSALLIIYILFLAIFWFLLRTAVRLIPDAPDKVLDERMIKERNSVYRIAYQFLFGISGVLAGALFGYALGSDFREENDGFNYQINLTWPQINAIFWLIFGYAYTLPSMIMAWQESKRIGSNSAKEI